MSLLHGTDDFTHFWDRYNFTDPLSLFSFHLADLALATIVLFLSYSQMGLNHIITMFCLAFLFFFLNDLHLH